MVKKIKPIQKMADIERLRRRLSSNPRDLLLFDLFTLAGLKVDHVLNLKVKDLDGLSEGDFISVTGRSVHNSKKPVMTRRIKETYDLMLRNNKPLQEDFLIKSKKSKAALAPPSVSRLVAQWFKEEKLEGLAGVKSLRKTWEYHFSTSDQSDDPAAQSDGDSIYGSLHTLKISDQIHSKLLDLILTGKLTPGERLIARHIAEEMNVSPMPVRDALNRLAANGFVNLEANRSYYVNALSKNDLIEITELRMILEPLAAVNASRRVSDQEIESIRIMAARFQRAVDHSARGTYVKRNRDFHFQLYNSTKNQKWVDILNQLWNMLSPYEYLLSQKSRSYDFKKGGYTNHREIVSALRQKDNEALEYWIKQDIMFAFDGIMAEFFPESE